MIVHVQNVSIQFNTTITNIRNISCKCRLFSIVIIKTLYYVFCSVMSEMLFITIVVGTVNSCVNFAQCTVFICAIQIVPMVGVRAQEMHAGFHLTAVSRLSSIPVDVGHRRLLRAHSPDELRLGGRVCALSSRPVTVSKSCRNAFSR